MRVLIVLLLIAGAWGGYRHFDAPKSEATPIAATAPARTTPTRVLPAPAQNFSCDGRQHCAQMRSCEEATFFIRNCPDTKMDGDRDGVPCESQHCG